MTDHAHEWYEQSRFFPLGELATDPDWLSPDGGHHPDVDDGALIPASHPALAGKVPPPNPYIALQCADAECRHIEHHELTQKEWDKIVEAYELGALDPDHNGTHRLISQLSLDDLGLSRIAAKMDDEQRRLSGATEDVLDGDAQPFVSGEESPVGVRAVDALNRALGGGDGKKVAISIGKKSSVAEGSEA